MKIYKIMLLFYSTSGGSLFIKKVGQNSSKTTYKSYSKTLVGNEKVAGRGKSSSACRQS